jgi:hypothetical protein
MAQPISTNSVAVCEGRAKLREDSLQASSVVSEPSPVAPATGREIADVVPMALGVRGFDIDPAAPKLSSVNDDVAIEDRRCVVPELSPVTPSAARRTADLAAPRMAPGVGGFNIDPPIQRASPLEGEVAIEHIRRRSLLKPRLIPLPPIEAERRAILVGNGESSFVVNLLAIIAVIAIIFLAFPDMTRKQLSDILRAVTSLHEGLSRHEALSSAGTSAHPARLVIESQKGFANEPLPLGISLKDASGEETVTVAGLAEGTELSLGTPTGLAGWLVSAHDLDKTFVGARGDFVGIMDATVNLRSASGQLLDSRIVRFEWIEKNKEESLLPARVTRTDTSSSAIGSRADTAP